MAARLSSRSWMHPTVNITPAERIGRIVLGLLGAVVGVVLLATGGGGLARTARPECSAGIPTTGRREVMI